MEKMIISQPEKRIILMVFIMIISLSVPLIAMQFTNEVNWTLFDLGVAAILLSATFTGIELILRNFRGKRLKNGLLIALLLLVLLIWVELSVGIFNSPIAGN